MSDYDVPEQNLYTKDDEWVRAGEDGHYEVGITDYAQQQLGDVVFVELPEVGSTLEAGQSFGVIESVKAVADLYSPLSGEVVRVNESLEDAPETVNENCYGGGWIVAIAPSNAEELEGLMSASAYRDYIAERADS